MECRMYHILSSEWILMRKNDEKYAHSVVTPSDLGRSSGLKGWATKEAAVLGATCLLLPDAINWRSMLKTCHVDSTCWFSPYRSTILIFPVYLFLCSRCFVFEYISKCHQLVIFQIELKIQGAPSYFTSVCEVHSRWVECQLVTALPAWSLTCCRKPPHPLIAKAADCVWWNSKHRQGMDRILILPPVGERTAHWIMSFI